MTLYVKVSIRSNVGEVEVMMTAGEAREGGGEVISKMKAIEDRVVTMTFALIVIITITIIMIVILTIEAWAERV